MEINANKLRPRSRNARFYWAFRKCDANFHTSELANLGEARRIRHLTRWSDARNASANACPPMHTHARTHARTHERTHASADAHAQRAHTHTHAPRARAHPRTRPHAQGPPRPHTRETGNWRHFSARSKCNAIAFSLTQIGASGMQSVASLDLTHVHAREAEE